jgi:hypothetical protein
MTLKFTLTYTYPFFPVKRMSLFEIILTCINLRAVILVSPAQKCNHSRVFWAPNLKVALLLVAATYREPAVAQFQFWGFELN